MNIHTLRDDAARTADHGYFHGEIDTDAPTASRAEAVEAVISLLTHESETAYGENLEWWLDVLADALADNQAGVLLSLLISDSAPSIRRFLAGHVEAVIESVANRLIADATQTGDQE